MAAEIANDLATAGKAAGIAPYRLSVAQFSRMIEAGVFPDGDRVELIGGILARKMTQNEQHAFGVDQMGHRLGLLLPPDWIARQEKPIVLGRFWRPEPDLVVAQGPRESYRQRFPLATDIALVIEVADSSYVVDRGSKWRRYASAGIACYGILNIPKRRFESFTQPFGKGRAAGYRNLVSYHETEAFPILLGGLEVGRIEVRDVLP